MAPTSIYLRKPVLDIVFMSHQLAGNSMNVHHMESIPTEYSQLVTQQPAEVAPQRTPFVLYRIFNSSDALLYVGATTNPKLRFNTHSSSQSWWCDAATIKLQHFGDLDALMKAEREAIESEHPLHNYIYCKPAHWARKKGRAAKGAGSVFQRADGYWVAGMEMPPHPNGKRHIKRFVAAERDVAIARRDAFRASLEQARSA